MLVPLLSHVLALTLLVLRDRAASTMVLLLLLATVSAFLVQALLVLLVLQPLALSNASGLLLTGHGAGRVWAMSKMLVQMWSKLSGSARCWGERERCTVSVPFESR